MKIAIIGSYIRQAPSKAGMINAPLQLSYLLARGLSQRNHDVTFFGIVDEKLHGKADFEIQDFGQKEIYSEIYGSSTEFYTAYEQGYMARIFKEYGNQFDLFYHHVPFRIGPFARLINTPIVTSHHDSSKSKEYEKMYQAMYVQNFFIIPISQSAKDRFNYENYLDVVYNGIESEKIEFYNVPEDYFCWIGRVLPSKGLHIALDLAEKLKFNLKVIGPMRKFPDAPDIDDYQNEMHTKMQKMENVEYLDILPWKKTIDYLSRSQGLIFPTDGRESCPLTALESIIAGVPVIGSDIAPLNEIISSNSTGFLCKNTDEYIQAIKNVESFNREKCRKESIEKYSYQKMSENYEKEFLKVLN